MSKPGEVRSIPRTSPPPIKTLKQTREKKKTQGVKLAVIIIVSLILENENNLIHPVRPSLGEPKAEDLLQRFVSGAQGPQALEFKACLQSLGLIIKSKGSQTELRNQWLSVFPARL